jgi:hypothetical protein
MNKKILFLDDDHDRVIQFGVIATEENWDVTYVENAPDCIQMLQDNIYDMVFLDHDLDNRHYVPSYEVNTGSEVVRWVISKNGLSNKDNVIIIVHTLNDKGGMQFMVDGLKSCGHTVYYCPAIWNKTFFNSYKTEFGF